MSVCVDIWMSVWMLTRVVLAVEFYTSSVMCSTRCCDEVSTSIDQFALV